MKFFSKKLIIAALLGAAYVIGATLAHAQGTTPASIVPHSPQSLQSVQSYSDTQLQELVNDLSSTPLIWPTNLPNNGVGGTYWSLAHPEWPPLPTAGGTPFWNLTSSSSGSAMSASAMSSDSTSTTGSSDFFLLDDVDYPPTPGGTNGDGGTNIIYFQPQGLTINTNGLWLEVPTNAYSLASNYFNVLIHNTTNGDFYDVLTKVNLLLPQWTVENTVTGAIGNLTPVTLSLNGRTNLFVWARTSELVLDTQPLSQEVVAGDTVTFTVAATGDDLSYQWTFDGTNIVGATGSSLTVANVNAAEAGSYACIITSATGSTTSQTATLTVDSGSGDAYQTQPIGQRQDYTFRNGVTYYIGSPVQLYGNTTFEPGAIIKFDYTQPDPTLQIMGTVTCKGTAYNPSILTTYDDNAYGEEWSDYSPQTYPTGIPYLDLSQASGDLSLTNVWFRYADEAVTTPANGRLDVWNGQFFQCNASILNESNGVDSLHNVLFAGCQEAVAASTNSFAIAAENITADVANLYTASVSPTYAVLTNSIVTGSADAASLENSTVAPAASNFQTNGAGNYYLAIGSTLHQAGTTNISPILLNEFRNKTTYAPIALPEFMTLSGNLTLSPQAARYTNGLPDEGYYYDALDYTVAGMTNFGTITVLPGTAIGFRQDLNTSTYWGFNLHQESSFVSHGTPTKPIVFTDVQWVQEQFEYPCYSFFVPNFEGATNDVAPAMDFRFCNFYPAVNWYEVWAGQNASANYMASYDSVVNWTMRDCNLYGGWISLGEPDNEGLDGSGGFFGIPYTTFYGVGSVTWNNNLFENESVNLQPSYYWYDGTINVDMAFSAYNNLFHGEASYFVIASQTSSSGNWTFEDNMFDKVNFYQDTALPLDYDYNGYWPLTAAELQSGYTNQFQTTTTGDGFTDGGHEQVLGYAPPFVAGAFGNYYLSTLTALYEAGSRTAGAAGLAQYTVFANQTKDAANSPVNIGLHYVAATNGVPLDSDGDGIPDYVEDANGNGIVDAGETDPYNPMTDGVNPDPSNSVYLNIDLSGDGLVGRVKAALGMNPLDPSNPLTLTQVITGREPDIASFEVPIAYNVLTNIGDLNLNINGIDAEFEGIYPATDGNSLIAWNADYTAPGQGYLQAKLTVNFTGDDTAVYAGVGPISPYISTNAIQFVDGGSIFTSDEDNLYAQLSQQNANYTIQLYDPSTNPATLLYTITGSTTNGVIQETWGVTNADGTPFTGNAVNATFTVSFSGGGDPTATQHQTRTSTFSDGGFDFAYMYSATNNLLSGDFGYVNPNNSGAPGDVWNDMLATVTEIISPVTAGNGGSSDPYNSGFDSYTSEGSDRWGYGTSIGYPGYLDSQDKITNASIGLLEDIASEKNFYCTTHGSKNSMASYDGTVLLKASDVASRLGNQFNENGITNLGTPFRFVFMDGCNTASKTWVQSFGILQTNLAGQSTYQAFVGWNGETSDYLGTSTSNITINLAVATSYAATLQKIYFQWMNGDTVGECINNAATQTGFACPLSVPSFLGKTLELKGSDRLGSYDILIQIKYAPPILIVGHSGITRGRYSGAFFDGWYLGTPQN